MNSTELVKYITEMLENNDYVAGHAIINRTNSIDETLPNKILNEGLIIQEATRGLPFTTRYFRLPYEECLFNLNYFIEDTSNAVIIVSIPGELLTNYSPEHFSSYNTTSIVLELTGKSSSEYIDVYGNPTNMALLPASFILGYLDTQKDTFIENPNYDFYNHNRAINISRLKPIYDKKYENILEENKLNLTRKL